MLHLEVLPFLQGISGAIFQQIMHAHMLQKLFETYIQPNTGNFFLGLLIRHRCYLLKRVGIWFVGISLLIRVLQLQGCAYKQYGILLYEQIFKFCLTPCHVV